MDSGGTVQCINPIILHHVPDTGIFDAMAMERLREFVAEVLHARVEVATGEDEYRLIPLTNDYRELSFPLCLNFQ